MSAAGDLIEIVDVSIEDSNNSKREFCEYDETAKIRVLDKAHGTLVRPIIHIRLWREDGTACFTVRSNQSDAELRDLILEGEGEIALRLAPLQLYGGSYRAEVVIVDSTNVERLAMANSSRFMVNGPGNIATEILGVYVPISQWELNTKQ